MFQGKHRRLIGQIERLKQDIQIEQTKALELVEVQEFEYAIYAFAGPMDSPYEGYWFRIKVQWGENYPFRPPKCTLVDKIWNPYVDYNTNQVCMDILDQQFSPALKTTDLILGLVSLLAETKVTSADGFLNQTAASQIMNNYPFFYEHARKICISSSYKQKQIYQNNMRGIPEQHFIKAEGEQLQNLIEKELKSEKLSKASVKQKIKNAKIQKIKNAKKWQKQAEQKVALQTGIQDLSLIQGLSLQQKMQTSVQLAGPKQEDEVISGQNKLFFPNQCQQSGGQTCSVVFNQNISKHKMKQQELSHYPEQKLNSAAGKPEQQNPQQKFKKDVQQYREKIQSEFENSLKKKSYYDKKKKGQ